MNKILTLTAILLVTTLTFGENTHHNDHEMKTSNATEVGVQTKCPVMGGEINKDLYVDHDGKRIYVCCQMCISKVKDTPEKFISQLEKEGVELEDILD